MTTSGPAPAFGPPPPYDDDCAEVLAGMPEFPPLTMEDLPAIRAGAEKYVPRPTNAELECGGTYSVEEKLIPGPHGATDIPLIICLPNEASYAAPVLYYIHGGGMFSGSARDVMGDVLNLAASINGALISVDYRLAPETPHPGPVEDCYQGLAWISAHARELNINNERVVLAGVSAGGGLAAGVALLARDRQGPSVFGQLLMSPMLDDRNNTLSVLQMASLRMWNKADNEIGWTSLLGDRQGGEGVDHYAAPARAEDLSGLPPTFLDVGSVDSFRDEDIRFVNRIWAAGGVAELHVWPGGFHGFESIAPKAALSIAAVKARVDWLTRLFRTI